MGIAAGAAVWVRRTHPALKIHQLLARLLEKSSGFRSSASRATLLANVLKHDRGLRHDVEVYDFATRRDELPAGCSGHAVRFDAWKIEKSWG